MIYDIDEHGNVTSRHSWDGIDTINLPDGRKIEVRVDKNETALTFEELKAIIEQGDIFALTEFEQKPIEWVF